jgi:hypothetical protein
VILLRPPRIRKNTAAHAGDSVLIDLDFYGDVAAAAMIDRLEHHAEVLTFAGNS